MIVAEPNRWEVKSVMACGLMIVAGNHSVMCMQIYVNYVEMEILCCHRVTVILVKEYVKIVNRKFSKLAHVKYLNIKQWMN